MGHNIKISQPDVGKNTIKAINSWN